MLGGKERNGVALVDYQVHGLHRERSHEQSRTIFFFGCKETRQTLRATWSCISSRLNAMIIDFFKDIFQCRGEIVVFIEPLFLADGFNFGTKADDDGE